MYIYVYIYIYIVGVCVREKERERGADLPEEELPKQFGVDVSHAADGAERKVG